MIPHRIYSSDGGVVHQAVLTEMPRFTLHRHSSLYGVIILCAGGNIVSLAFFCCIQNAIMYGTVFYGEEVTNS